MYIYWYSTSVDYYQVPLTDVCMDPQKPQSLAWAEVSPPTLLGTISGVTLYVQVKIKKKLVQLNLYNPTPV